MGLDDLTLMAIAAALSDGSKIDWERASSDDDDERALLEALRLVAEVIAAHSRAPSKSDR